MLSQDRETREDVEATKERAVEKLAEIDGRKERQFIAYERGEITLEEYAGFRRRLQSEEEELKAIVARAEAALRQKLAIDDWTQLIIEIVNQWGSLPRPHLKENLRAILEAVYVYEDKPPSLVFT